MRLLGLSAAAAAASGAIIIAACSNSSTGGNGSAVPSVTRAVTPMHGTARLRPDSISTNDLFVGYYYSGSNYIEIYQNGTFKKIGRLNYDVNGPFGSWVDSHGLYIANDVDKDITQYSSLNSKPFLYSAGILYPVAVTTDAHGNIFEGDFGKSSGGWINEYAQKTNKVEKQCSIAANVTGVAVDASGDVFYAYVVGSGSGYIGEITDFGKCYGRGFSVTLRDPAKMVLDKSNNIIICDQKAKTVDIIKPPYSKVSSHLGSGYADPYDVTINSANNRAWVTDAGAGAVIDLYYPGGKRVATISGYVPISAVDGSNYVP